MRPLPRTRSFERPMTRLVYFTAITAFLTGLAASHWVSRRDRLVVERSAAVDAAGLLAATLAGDDDGLTNPSTRLERMVDHPRTLAAAIWREGEDRPVCIAARDPAARTFLDQSQTAVAKLGQSGPSRWAAVTTPIVSTRYPSATLGLILVPALNASGGLSAPLTLLLAALALAPAIFTSHCLRTQFFRPLGWLVNGLADDSRRPLGRLLRRRNDEIGVLAGELARRRRKARFWRRRCNQWIKDNDARVYRETHDIRTQLHRTQKEAERDALTGILNRRQLERRLDALFDAQRIAGEDMSIVMLDVDHFKHLNDTLGHAAGDALLAFTGELIRSHTRASDLAVRYGGDEFTLVLPGLSEERAGILAGRLISLFAQRARALGVHPAPTLSGGVAGLLSRRAKSPSELLALADKALYEAKREGKRSARSSPHADQSTAPAAMPTR